MNIDEELSKFGLTRETYEECMDDIVDKLNGINDMDWSEIQVKYNLPCNFETLRRSQSRPFGGAFVREYYASEYVNLPESYTEQVSVIRKERQRLFDERAALNQINRENGRIENDLDYLEKLIKENGYKQFSKSDIKSFNSDNDLLICLSDIHYGLDVSNSFGKYNSEIAEQRMSQYLDEIFNIQNLYKSENAYVVIGGDSINGNIHYTTRLQNRENVVEQIQGVSELIAWFIYELSKRFNHIYINSVDGNHSRIGFKSEVLRDERLDSLVPWYIEAKLDGVDNVTVLKDQYDPTIISLKIRGKEYLAVHGDNDNFSESGINKLVAMVGFRPEAIIYGHLHKCSYDDISGVKIIRSGSFAAPVDDYTISKRITGRPSQMICVVDQSGIKSIHPVELK